MHGLVWEGENFWLVDFTEFGHDNDRLVVADRETPESFNPFFGMVFNVVSHQEEKKNLARHRKFPVYVVLTSQWLWRAHYFSIICFLHK